MGIRAMSHQQLESLVNKFPEEFFHLTEYQQKISIQVYRMLAEGEPVSPSLVAELLHLSKDSVMEALNHMGGVFFDDDGCIVGYLGLTPIHKMPFQFQVNGHNMFTWCAWDSLFIPPIIDKSVLVKTECPITNEEIQLTVTPDGVKDITPSTTVMSYIETETDKIRSDVIQSFCHHVLFFSSEEAGEKWITEQEGKHFLMSIQDAYKLGRIKNQRQYKLANF